MAAEGDRKEKRGEVNGKQREIEMEKTRKIEMKKRGCRNTHSFYIIATNK